MATKDTQTPTVAELQARRAALAAEVASFEKAAREAEDKAGELLAEGKSIAAVTAEMEAATAKARVARAGLAALDRQIEHIRGQEQERRRQVVQAEAEKVNAVFVDLLATLHGQLQTARETLAKADAKRAELARLCARGARMRTVGTGCTVKQLDLAIAQLENALLQVPGLDVEALGIKRPPTPGERMLMNAQARLRDERQRLATLQEQQAGSGAIKAQQARVLEAERELAEVERELAEAVARRERVTAQV